MSSTRPATTASASAVLGNGAQSGASVLVWLDARLRRRESELRHAVRNLRGPARQLADQRLWQVRHAMQRLACGDFSCARCTATIEPTFLLVAPTTDLCPDCAATTSTDALSD